MAALSLSVRPDGEWALVHECLSCGELSVNRIAGDDNALALMRMAVRPLGGHRRPRTGPAHAVTRGRAGPAAARRRPADKGSPDTSRPRHVTARRGRDRRTDRYRNSAYASSARSTSASPAAGSCSTTSSMPSSA
ncbi:RNHCP domain-containing protein [Streptomyces sp. NPDC001834]|uniref:RNHCP domain-containing protein n=1 Tax=Streptomyces sp. NPDC001834 TaxID=3364616 RepID=UPI0036A99177